MHNWKRFVLVLMTLLMISNITACKNNKEKENNGEMNALTKNHKQVYSELGLMKYNPPIEVSFVRELSNDFDSLIASLPGESLSDNRWSQLYEQVLGIRISYDWTAKGDVYRQKLDFAVSSGKIPDVVKVNAEQLRVLSNAGFIQDLSDVYEDYATPLTKNTLSQEGIGPFETATIDGKLMAIPVTSSSIENATYLWVRTDWLDNLELDPPKTMNDLREISRAFTNQDPDKNGLDDTYGLALTNYLWDPILDVKGFMAGFEAFPKLWIEDSSGNLVFGGIQPEVKEALQILQDMYKKGEIDNEFSLKNGSKVQEQVIEGKVGMLYGEQWGSFFVQDSRIKNANADWQAFPIVSASDKQVKVPLEFSTGEFFAVSKNFQYPESIVKLFNLHLEKNWGKTADYETYYSNPYPVWQLSPVTPFPPMKNLEAYRQIVDACMQGDTSRLNNEAKNIYELIEKYIREGSDKEVGWGWARSYGENGAFSILDQYESNGQLLYDKFTGAPTTTMIERESFLNDLQHETYLNIILGDSIDKFDVFVDMWNKLGGEQMTREVNEWYIQNK
ncbi:extracellular solute-binding protein [Lederbergia ruris]|uniref:ABC transporter peptide-binding protein YtcQ n=1 Tax=Lederbergia ruris TaxID=217495 RepID=A0ABQ4KFB2_9BACI|nr:extracellular solute-binding protein [Lederbergia ruris]GIN56071.1 putative ABC transporter peptide-binding protein YtcQ [Lederbergia ruris]